VRRDQLEHLIRAAGGVTGSRRIVIIGSQAILGQFPFDAPPRTTLSVEADLLPFDCPENWELVSGSLGELSPFHNTFGYFGDGVSLTTAKLPTGWQDRLVPVENANTNGYVGLCLEVHDILISKYCAGRDKDLEFCVAVVHAGLVQQRVLEERLATTPCDEQVRARVAGRIAADFRTPPKSEERT
jgi:hypothetical protein